VTADDTSGLSGGPIIRYGGKGKIAPYLVSYFAPAKVWAEPFFGAGSVFYRLGADLYERAAINDLDRSIVTFFRVLRDRTDDLVRACEFTPYARDEFIAALERSDDDLEEARRVWVRSRQGFSGHADGAGDWGRSDGKAWRPSKSANKAASLRAYAGRLLHVEIDSIDAAEFISKRGNERTFIYADPPYVQAARFRDCGGSSGKGWYGHEMTDADHRRIAAACHEAVERGAKVAISGYPSALYDELFARWRCVEVEVPLAASVHGGARRTECLWMSYPHEASFAGIAAAKATARQPSLFGVLA
jgi:DNA adenine methylase